MRTVLESLGKLDWELLRRNSARKDFCYLVEWWHNKYYRENPPNDGFVAQLPSRGAPEIPYAREIFHPSPTSRFSLGTDDPVAYLSNDFVVNCCETIPEFSSSPSLSFGDEIEPYTRGRMNPTPGWMGFPLNFNLSRDATFLDLSNCNGAFYEQVESCAGAVTRRVIAGLISSREVAEKIATQAATVDYAK